ncbi:MAG: TonB-dependent receptor [Bacteroidota bacterium]|nr:TonB-dependent receptor [Bacteroidota bacterium]
MKLVLKSFFGILFLLIFNASAGQTLSVLDQISGNPVPDVAVFNQAMNKSVISKHEGEASLEIFNLTDTIILQHPAYKRISVTISQLEKMGYIIYLEKDVRMLDEFVLIVNRWEQEINEVPNKISIISRTDIQLYNPQTTADLLSINNAVFLQKSQLGGGSPMIRGFAANSVLLVVDGVRMNNAIYRSGNLQNVISLDPNIIEQSEVVYGPGSVVYGSDALGGVLDFHTINPKLSTGKQPYLSLNAITRLSTANNEKLGHFDLNLGFQKWAFLSSISYSDYEDLKMGSVGHPSYLRNEYVSRINGGDTIIQNENPSLQKFSGYSQINFTGKVRFKPKNNLNFNYTFHYSKASDIPRYDRLIQYDEDKLKYAQWYYGPQKWFMHFLNGAFEQKTFLYDNAKLTMAYQQYEESRHYRRLNEIDLFHRFEKVDIFSFNYDLYKDLGNSLSVFYGIETVFNNVSSIANSEDITTGIDSPIPSRYPNGLNHYYTLAIYSMFKYNLNERINLNAGLRYNYIYLYSTIEDNSFYNFPFEELLLKNSALNGSLGFVFRHAENSQINVNLASGFRAPNLDDVAKIFDSEPGGVVVPNDNLEPEYTYNIDLGWIKTFHEIVDLEITGFYTYLKDAMVRRPYTFNGFNTIMYDREMSNVYAVVNAKNANLYGFSLNLGLMISPSFSLKTDFTYMKGKDNEDYPLRHIPPYYGGFHILFEKAIIKADLYALYNGEISNENLSPEEQFKLHMYELDQDGMPYSPSWYSLNFKTSVQVTKKLTFLGGIENILDHRYRPYSSGIVAPGRNFFFSIRVGI